ncbi:MAG TPA: HAMP domain-containing sensor histidine kinase [Gaiellaceae bacterium]|nr:HAMP domain-containing sensor histidine kinase [Gaiellaceae bacterium]
MRFRTRLTLAVAAAVAVAVALAAVGAYFAARGELVGNVDTGLRQTAEQLQHTPPDRLLGFRGPFAGAYYQVVLSDGETQLPAGLQWPLPVTPKTKAVARGTTGEFFTDLKVGPYPSRMLTFPYGQGIAVQLVSNVQDIDNALAQLRWILVAVGLGGVLFAIGLGYLVTRAVLTPVRRLTEASEHVAATRDLRERMDASRRDELGRLAASFNTMLGALEESVAAQRQLVADASHELRTPLTSLRTNIEVLARSDGLPAAERERLLADVVEQLAEMTALVAELVELARGEQVRAEPEEVRLDLLVESAVERAQRNHPGLVFVTHLAETAIEGVPATIERAVGNLLDNAAKWSPAGGTVEVVVREGQVTVRDHGPGIDEADLPHVFDRFYRAAAARGMPGSGLGLAIVKQVAESHGGEVAAERAAGGGTVMRLRLLATS